MLTTTASLSPTRPTPSTLDIDSALTAADLGRLHLAESAAADDCEKKWRAATSRTARRALDAECDRLRAHADAMQSEVLRRPVATLADALAVAVTGYTVSDVAPDNGWADVVFAFTSLRGVAGRLGFDMPQPWARWTGQEDYRGQDWTFMRAAFSRVALALDGRDGATLADFIGGVDLGLLRGSVH